MNRTGLKASLVTAVAVLTTLVTATAAQAAPTVSVSGGYTTMGSSTGSWGTTFSGVVYDTAADGYCIRVYGAGYNYIRGWGSGNYRGQACGSGTSTRWSETPAVYSDNYAVSLCRGMPNATRSNCTPYYRVR